jgi:hypothetical protein
MLAKVAANGFAVRTGKYPPNTSSIAVPILVDRIAIATVSVSFLTTALALDRAIEMFVKPLLAVAGEISLRLTTEPRRRSFGQDSARSNLSAGPGSVHNRRSSRRQARLRSLRERSQ